VCGMAHATQPTGDYRGMAQGLEKREGELLLNLGDGSSGSVRKSLTSNQSAAATQKRPRLPPTERS
jgi:hypothetical protein